MLAREQMKMKDFWHLRFEKVYKLMFDDFKSCYEVMKKYFPFIISFYENLNDSKINKNKDSFQKNPGIQSDKKYKSDIISNSSLAKHEGYLKKFEEKLFSYRALSNEKFESNRILLSKEKILYNSTEEIVKLDKINDKNFQINPKF